MTSRPIPFAPECEETDLLPGEENLHRTLQYQLIEALAAHHRVTGRVVHLAASITKSGSKAEAFVRSVEAKEGRYSCEFFERHPTSGEVTGCEFFALLPPIEEASEASVLILAKAAAVASHREAEAVAHQVFDALLTDSF